jgi:hypothetical protein
MNIWRQATLDGLRLGLFGPVALWFLFGGTMMLIGEARAMRNGRLATCHVVGSWVYRGERSHFSPRWRLELEPGGPTVSSSLDSGGARDLQSAERLLEAHPIGSTQQCWYNPIDRKDLREKAPSGSNLLRVLAVMFIPTGLCISVWRRRGRRRSRISEALAQLEREPRDPPAQA